MLRRRASRSTNCCVTSLASMVSFSTRAAPCLSLARTESSRRDAQLQCGLLRVCVCALKVALLHVTFYVGDERSEFRDGGANVINDEFKRGGADELASGDVDRVERRNGASATATEAGLRFLRRVCHEDGV